MKGNFLFSRKKQGSNAEKKVKKSREKWSRRKKFAVIAVLLATVLAAGGGIVYFVCRKENTEGFPFGKGDLGSYSFPTSENMVSASGVISAGVTEERFEVENLSAELVIEEVYVSSDQEIEEGTQILKLTEESVSEAREELEKKLLEAELAYRAGVIDYEQSKITAEYDYQSVLLAGEQAGEIYQETIASLESSVQRAEKELAEAQEQIEEYQSYVNDGSYKSHFKVDEYQALYDENYKLLTEKMEEWGVSWEQVTGGGQGGSYSNASILSGLYKVLEQNRKDLDQAESDSEEAVINAAFELQTLQLELPSLQKAAAEAREEYEIQLGQAKLTYEQTLAGAERAESDYETALEKAESDYETLLYDYEDAKKNLELFESSVGDGCYRACGSGTILRTMVRADGILTSDSVIFMYSNPEEMSITVAIDQSDIAKLAVGDEAYVQSGDGTGSRGTITAIYPVTASESRTNVTYSVTVTLSGDTSSYIANQSVTVLFGLSADELESMQNRNHGTMEQMPAAGEGMPAEGEGTPAEGEGMPAAGEGTPAEGEGTPAEGEGMPAVREGMPAEGEGTPAEGGRMPEGGAAR